MPLLSLFHVSRNLTSRLFRVAEESKVSQHVTHGNPAPSPS